MPQTEVVYLCPDKQLSVFCSTNQTYLEWEITLPPPYYYHIDVSSSVHMGNYSWRHIGDATINYTKDSVSDVLPLTSTLLINPVTTSFNGAIIRCNERITYFGIFYRWEEISTTVIQVINGKLK